MLCRTNLAEPPLHFLIVLPKATPLPSSPTHEPPPAPQARTIGTVGRLLASAEAGDLTHESPPRQGIEVDHAVVHHCCSLKQHHSVCAKNAVECCPKWACSRGCGRGLSSLFLRLPGWVKAPRGCHRYRCRPAQPAELRAPGKLVSPTRTAAPADRQLNRAIFPHRARAVHQYPIQMEFARPPAAPPAANSTASRKPTCGPWAELIRS
jgi:hypothetical protein